MHPAAAAAARAAMGSPARQLSAAPAPSTAPPAPCSDPASPPRTQCSAPSSPLTPPETAATQEAEKERPVEKTANTTSTTTTNFWGMSKEEEIDPRDLEISLLKKRLEETEKAMERIVAQMGAVTSRLAPHIISQAMDDVNRQHCHTASQSKGQEDESGRVEKEEEEDARG